MLLAFILIVGVLWVLALLDAAGRFATRRGAAEAAPPPAPLPRVSILIAARNEETALPRCLASLHNLRYPPHLLEVLLGNDASTDRTAAVAAAAMHGFAGRFEVVEIKHNLGQARGKANVLAHLARRATTDFFFITDADISLPISWVSEMLTRAAPGVGTVTGITAVRGPRVFDQLQGLDWLFSLGLLQVVSDTGRPVTAMGNNMLISRAAYEATGGYEALPFSVTEDYALFQAVIQHGFGFRQVFEAAVRADSLPMPTWGGLLRQRRRWLRGVAALPLRLRLELLAFSSIWLVLAGLGWLAGPWALLAGWLVKLLAQSTLMRVAYRRAGLRLPWHLLPLFEVYTLALTLMLPVYRLLHPRVEWKGREYK